MHALQRLGIPEDIAGLASVLVSPEAGWITGQVIGVTGGRSALRKGLTRSPSDGGPEWITTVSRR
jgi:NAD(P)-dependent dehydrogenase (short-subunit alcohol dehydrogenase family)